MLDDCHTPYKAYLANLAANTTGSAPQAADNK